MQKILVTGTAGFIGFHLAKELLAEGWRVHGFEFFATPSSLRIDSLVICHCGTAPTVCRVRTALR